MSTPTTDGELPKDKPSDWGLRYAANLLRETDRGCVLVTASDVSERLGSLLKARCRADHASAQKALATLLEGPTAPLGSLWARSQLAYALGLIPTDVFEFVEALRRIRNLMAHSTEPLDFDHPEIRKHIQMPTLNEIQARHDTNRLALGQDITQDASHIGKGRAALERKLIFAFWATENAAVIDAHTQMITRSIPIAEHMPMIENSRKAKREAKNKG